MIAVLRTSPQCRIPQIMAEVRMVVSSFPVDAMASSVEIPPAFGPRVHPDNRTRKTAIELEDD